MEDEPHPCEKIKHLKKQPRQDNGLDEGQEYDRQEKHGKELGKKEKKKNKSKWNITREENNWPGFIFCRVIWTYELKRLNF